MILSNPRFIVFHQGGSGGDFLNSIVNYLHKKDNNIIIDNFGQNHLADDIANSKDYFMNMKQGKVEDDTIDFNFYSLVSHFYAPEIFKKFPHLKAYYIDYTNYEKQVCYRCFELVCKGNKENIVKMLKDGSVLSEKLKFNITVDNWEKIAILTWKNWLKLYKYYDIDSIPLKIFFDYTLFSKTIEEKFLLKPDDYVKVMFDIWQEKNKRFFKELQVD